MSSDIEVLKKEVNGLKRQISLQNKRISSIETKFKADAKVEEILEETDNNFKKSEENLKVKSKQNDKSFFRNSNLWIILGISLLLMIFGRFIFFIFGENISYIIRNLSFLGFWISLITLGIKGIIHLFRDNTPASVENKRIIKKNIVKNIENQKDSDSIPIEAKTSSVKKVVSKIKK